MSQFYPHQKNLFLLITSSRCLEVKLSYKKRSYNSFFPERVSSSSFSLVSFSSKVTGSKTNNILQRKINFYRSFATVLISYTKKMGKNKCWKILLLVFILCVLSVYFRYKYNFSFNFLFRSIFKRIVEIFYPSFSAKILNYNLRHINSGYNVKKFFIIFSSWINRFFYLLLFLVLLFARKKY